MKPVRPVNTLMADDCMLMKEALDEKNLPNTIDFVKDGKELMHYLYKKGKFTTQPIVIPGTSPWEREITHTYDVGVSSFICKPVKSDQLIEITQATGNYWFRTVTLPLQ